MLLLRAMEVKREGEENEKKAQSTMMTKKEPWIIKIGPFAAFSTNLVTKNSAFLGRRGRVPFSYCRG